jgi:hypothetical protein
MSGAITRRSRARAGIAWRQLAQALTPGPEPWIISTGGCRRRADIMDVAVEAAGADAAGDFGVLAHGAGS